MNEVPVGKMNEHLVGRVSTSLSLQSSVQMETEGVLGHLWALTEGDMAEAAGQGAGPGKPVAGLANSWTPKISSRPQEMEQNHQLSPH